MNKILGITEKQCSLFERIEMLLMIKEQYNYFLELIKEDKNSFYERFKFIEKKRFKQLYFSYIFVVLERIDEFIDDFGEVQEIIKIYNKEYQYGNNKKRLYDLLKRHRDKTFHFDSNIYENINELYRLNLLNVDKEVGKIYKLIESIYNNNNTIQAIRVAYKLRSKYNKNFKFKKIERSELLIKKEGEVND